MLRGDRLKQCVGFFAIAAICAWSAAPALARWRLVGEDTSSLAYNQGITAAGAGGKLLFDGVSSQTNSGVYRTDGQLRPEAANLRVIPTTREGYNHAGDLSFDSRKDRILLPLECYYPQRGGNTCGEGAVGVVDPVTLRFRYYVNLARRQINKAMWGEVEPDGRWIWTSSGTHLLVYRSADINAGIARRQRAGRQSGIVGVDLGAVLPSGAVTGATFYPDGRVATTQLLLSLNLGRSFEVVSIRVGSSCKKQPKVLSRPKAIITLSRSSLNQEPEGLTSTGAHGRNQLRWQMLPAITSATAFTRILTYLP